MKLIRASDDDDECSSERMLVRESPGVRLSSQERMLDTRQIYFIILKISNQNDSVRNTSERPATPESSSAPPFPSPVRSISRESTFSPPPLASPVVPESKESTSSPPVTRYS